MGNNPSYFKDCGDDCPVEQVSWKEVKGFIRQLNLKVGGKENGAYRLPSEAEWEYGCRGGGKHSYCGSDDVDRVAWYRQNSAQRTHRVGTRAANGFGLNDMSGNALEWVEDCWHDNYSTAPSSGEPWTSGGNCSVRGVRGGSWIIDPAWVRAAERNWFELSHRNSRLGFRLAKTLF